MPPRLRRSMSDVGMLMMDPRLSDAERQAKIREKRRQERLFFGNYCPTRLTRHGHRCSFTQPPEYTHHTRGFTCQTSREQRFEQPVTEGDWKGGNKYRARMRSGTHHWESKWDADFHVGKIPGLNVNQDPFLLRSYLQTVSLYRQGRRPMLPGLEADGEKWNKQVLAHPLRMELEAQREKMPWPEYQVETSAAMGRRWQDFTPGMLRFRPGATPHGIPTFDGGTYNPPRIAKYDTVEHHYPPI